MIMDIYKMTREIYIYIYTHTYVYNNYIKHYMCINIIHTYVIYNLTATT